MSTPIPDIDLLFRQAILPKMWGRRTTASFGTLPLPSGRLVVADPLELEYSRSWLTVPPGEYNVVFAIEEMEYQGKFYPEVAAVRLNITDATVALWEEAVVDGEVYSHGIDSATACFVDANAAEALRALDDHSMLDIWNGFVNESIRDMVEVPGGTAFFFSTCDDGGLPVYQGLDASGALAAIAVVLPRASFEVGIDYDESFFKRAEEE